MSETHPRRRHWAIGLSMFGAASIASMGFLSWTSASFTDEASAVVEASGSYDIAVEAPDATGTPVVGQGNPQDVVLDTPAGTTFTLTTPVSWNVSVVNLAAGGTVSVRLSDPADTPFSVGATAFPDLFHVLTFTLTDAETGALLASGPADTITAAPIDLGYLDNAERRDLTLSAIITPKTWSVYDTRTTSLRLTFQGTT